MRNVRAFNRESGAALGQLHAMQVNEDSRYGADYKCLNPACSCTFHWRKEVRAKENTEYRPETFVKNKSSNHVAGCSYDYKGFAHTHRDIVYSDGSDLHIRLAFPVGSGPQDRMPSMRGMLTEAQRRAANSNINYKGVGSLSELSEFLEKHFAGGLEDPGLEDLVLHYQGEELPWRERFFSSERYRALLGQARRGDETACFTLIKPSHSVQTGQKGKSRHVCEGQYVQDPDGKMRFVQPVIVTRNAHVRTMLDEAMENGTALLISGRPFMPRIDHTQDRYIYFYCNEDQQVAGMNKTYWRVPVPGARHQMSLDLEQPYRP
jgi:hypothetical protein